MVTPPPRPPVPLSELPEEAASALTGWLGSDWTVEPLPGDVSVRRYFRIRTTEGTRILAWYPPDVRRQLARVVAANEALAPGLPVPAIYACSESAILQEDVGDLTLYRALEEDRAAGVRLFGRAVDLLDGLQSLPDPGLNPPFTAEFFVSELEMAREYFVEKLTGGDGRGAAGMFETLARTVARHPYVVCHRDYHGHNIHIVNGSLSVIDYQDVRLGPDTYDLASLLRDRGVGRLLGGEVELELLERRGAASPDPRAYRRRYYETLLQRSVKIIGTFAKQPIVRGWTRYLAFIPSTLESIHRCLDQLPEFEALRDIFPVSFDTEAAAQRVRELKG